MHMYVCIYIYAYTCMNIHIYIYTYMVIHTYIHTDIQVEGLVLQLNIGFMVWIKSCLNWSSRRILWQNPLPTTRSPRPGALEIAPRVQVPNNHILSKILTYITTILNPST